MSVSSKKNHPAEEQTETGAAPQAPQEVTLEHALKLAQAHHRNGNLEIAERTYRDILRAAENHFPTVQLLSAILFQRGNIEEALTYARIATEVESEDAGCWSNYAATLSTLGRYDEALDAYDQALAMNPELVEAYVNKSYTLWLLKRYEEAEETAAQATLMDESRPDAFLNLGIALAAQGKYNEAEEVWQQVVALDPSSGRAYANWSNALRESGDLEGAIEKGLKAVELGSEEADAHNNLGCAYRDFGEYDKALECFGRATDLKPEYVDAHINKAKTHLSLQRPKDAIVAARYALSFDKNSANSYIVMAHAYFDMGENDKARQNADVAINLEPEEPYHLLVLIDIMIDGEMHDEAEALLQKVLKLAPAEPLALMKLASVRRSLDMLDEAVEAIDAAIANFQETPPILIEKARILMHASRVEEGLKVIDRALALAPQGPMVLLTKAELLLTINRVDEARQILEDNRDLLDNQPGYYYSLTSFKKFKKDDPDFQKLLDMIPSLEGANDDYKTILHFSLHEAYHNIGDEEKAFAHLKAANDIRAPREPLELEKMMRFVTMQKNMFSPDIIHQYEGYGSQSDLPVFIVGMPRSGTTLTEQIISSHPDVYGAGELHDISTILRLMGPLTQENAAAMGDAYVARMRARDVSGKAKRITDKMPGNYNNLAFIRAILPHAKIIHCRRSPMDNLLSCYKQNFASGHQWSYTLDGLAKQYQVYSAMMDYWREVLPKDSFIEIDYEDTVSNLEDVALRLIDYIGLPWDPACLEPHKQKRAVLTASKDQVIQPVYQSSVEAWRAYEKHLMPLHDALKAAGCIS